MSAIQKWLIDFNQKVESKRNFYSLHYLLNDVGFPENCENEADGNYF